ncbi:MAG TPA: ABC transporter permease [Dehalococcoidia bacterium]|nr:ABC transporter permease [Dehalococcoidia bacterium]
MIGFVAVVGRDLRAVVRSRSQLYSSILLPLMLLALLGTGVSDGLEPAALEDGDYTAFLVPGMIVMTAVFSSTFASASFYQDRANGILRLMLVSPLPAAAVLGGKVLAAVVIGTIQAIVVLVVAAIVPSIDLNWQYGIVGSLALALIGIVLFNVLICVLALLLATRIQTMQGFHLVMNLVLFPLLFLSGAFFPLEDLPLWLKVLGYANPLTYPVDLLQLALYADGTDGQIGLALDLAVMFALLALLSWPLLRIRPGKLALVAA